MDQVSPDSAYKLCPDCQTVKPLEQFTLSKKSRDGRGTYCRVCFIEMVAAQGGTCAVCDGKPEHVDHDHKTGLVRGILCFNCNQALGNVRDDPAVLEGLIRYLRRHGMRSVIQVDEYMPPEHVVFEVDYRHRSA